MKFEQALAALRGGKKVTRPYLQLLMNNSYLIISESEGRPIILWASSTAQENYLFLGANNQLFAEDWEIVDG